MAHGLNSVLSRKSAVTCKNEGGSGKTGAARRIFAPHFKLQVLDSYRHDSDCKGNQRATARKYGIHRRQIQKWLQVENNLRNSVCGNSNNNNNNNSNKCGGFENICKNESAITSINGCEKRSEVALRIGRLQDASNSASASASSSVSEPPSSSCFCGNLAVVPAAPSQREVKTSCAAAASPLIPLDFTIRAASPIVASSDDSSPSPISLRHTVSDNVPIDLSLKRIGRSGTIGAVAPDQPIIVPLNQRAAASAPSTSVVQHPDVWDLSKKRKLEDDPNTTRISPPVKTVKLFKPYLLDDLKDSSSASSRSSTCSASSSSSSTSSCEECPPCCTFQPNNLYNFNNNNNNIEIKAEYTIHELQPKNTNSNCYSSSSFPSGTAAYSMLYQIPEYEPISYYRNFDDNNANYGNFVQRELRQRQSYSLDFKLSAIDCYHEDSVCKGNQRAVALKYNIHRRQVQKWLKREDELRQKNEFVKHSQQELVR